MIVSNFNQDALCLERGNEHHLVGGITKSHGLFTAHITGNVVFVAAHYVTGGFSQVGPLLAVPIFMAVMGLVTLASGAFVRTGSSPLRPLLLLQTALLGAFLGIGVGLVVFPMPRVRLPFSRACSAWPPWRPRMYW
jgi:uncharacterized membrane protein YoaK (UPF0700 family)